MEVLRTRRLGELLVDAGELTDAQLASLLTLQSATGRPLGDLAERHAGVSPHAIERAWVRQYRALGTGVALDRETIDPSVRSTIGRRAAWQLRLLPLRREDGLLIVATTADRLARAATWAGRRIGEPVHLVIADREALHRGLARAYPCPALAALDRGRVRRGAA